MYFLIRGIICILLLLTTLFGINRLKIRNKQRAITICIIIFGVLFFVLGFLPLERIMFRFDSPIDAYEYRNPDSVAMLVIEGDESAFVIGQRDGTDVIMMVPKKQEKWLVGTGSELETVARRFNGKVSISIRRYKETNDYYISVYEIGGQEIQIIDSNNTEFTSLERKEDSFIKYYAFIPDYDENYWISVEGEKIELRNEK